MTASLTIEVERELVSAVARAVTLCEAIGEGPTQRVLAKFLRTLQLAHYQHEVTAAQHTERVLADLSRDLRL